MRKNKKEDGGFEEGGERQSLPVNGYRILHTQN